MGLFIFESADAGAAEKHFPKLALGAPEPFTKIDWRGETESLFRWRKHLPKARRASRKASVTAPRMRPCETTGDLSNAKAKAVEYALWLAARDGTPIARKDWTCYDAAKRDKAAPTEALVSFHRFKLSDGTNACQAKSVYFGGIDRLIPIPHCGYDATKPAIEETEPGETLSGWDALRMIIDGEQVRA